MKKILKILIYVVIIFILVFNISSIFNLQLLGCQLFRVASGSMEPVIKIGDIIFIKKQENYKVNDIITYKNNNEYVTHRIIEINEENVITKGDSNQVPDKEFEKDDIVGKYIFKFPQLGNIIEFLTHPIMIILFWGIVIIFKIIVNLKDPYKPKRFK